METSALQNPRTGRSRFSKALPVPPVKLDDQRPKTAPRELPSLPPTPFPPRKDSILVKARSARDLKIHKLDSPLPSLPPEAEIPVVSQMQTQMRSISRRPVGVPLKDQPQHNGMTMTTSKEKKRVSSISSLLSAYSHTSSDSVNRSSQESVFTTKDSEPSHSPERDLMNIGVPESTKALTALVGNPYHDVTYEQDDETAADKALPPPLPLKDPSRSTTPREAHEPNPSRGDDVILSPQAGDSPPRREIWKRRASSKSDRGLAVAELKLAVSHGSTMATSSAILTNPPTIPLPPSPPPKIASSNHIISNTSSLPPRSASLPGKNVRPIKSTSSADDSNSSSDEMVKLPSLSKLKGLAKRRDGSKNEADNKREREQEKELPNAPELSSDKNDLGSDKPRPPSKDVIAASETKEPVAQPGALPLSPPSSPTEYPPHESAATKPITRRPVGTTQQRSAQQPDLQKRPSRQDLQQRSGLPATPRDRLPSSSRPPFPSPLDTTSSETRFYRMGRSHTGLLYPMPGPPVVVSGLPAHPRNAALRRDQESYLPPVSATQRPLVTPANSDEPLPKPQLYDLIEHLSEATNNSYAKHKETPNTEARAYGNFTKPAPPRMVSPDTHSVPLSDVHEEASQSAASQAAGPESMDDGISSPTKNALTPEQLDTLQRALRLFPRVPTTNIRCDADGIWPARALDKGNFDCWGRHGQFVISKNVHYPLACQMCKVGDRKPRKVCSTCQLRICMKCWDALLAHGRDLETTLAAIEDEKKDEIRRGKEVMGDDDEEKRRSSMLLLTKETPE